MYIPTCSSLERRDRSHYKGTLESPKTYSRILKVFKLIVKMSTIYIAIVKEWLRYINSRTISVNPIFLAVGYSR